MLALFSDKVGLEMFGSVREHGRHFPFFSFPNMVPVSKVSHPQPPARAAEGKNLEEEPENQSVCTWFEM